MLTRAGNRVATYYPRCREGIKSIRVLATDLVMGSGNANKDWYLGRCGEGCLWR